MPEVPVQALRDAIRGLHGCDSAFVESVPVVERLVVGTEGPGGGRIVWQGAVCMFDLIGHPTAKRAYAWSAAVDGSEKRRFTAVLHTGKVDSPVAAVRASIVAENRGR